MPDRNPDGTIPADQWIVYPPADSADYLEGEPPTYADGGEADDGAGTVVDQEATDG